MDTIKLEAEAAELADRIRREAARPRHELAIFETSDSHAMDAVPAVDHLRPKPIRAEKFAALLDRAHAKTNVSPRIPKFLRRLFRKQGGYNMLLLEALRLLMRMVRNLHVQSTAFAAHLEAQTAWLDSFASWRETSARARAQDRATLSVALSDLDDLRNRFVRLEAKSARNQQTLENQLARANTEIQALTARLAEGTDRQDIG